jgi:lysophospholipase L1-like esterase
VVAARRRSDHGRALDGFFEALARADDGEAGALVRVTHMGDSSIGLDALPHELRTRFQDRFGDGGAGFINVQPDSGNYRNRAVELSVPTPWDFCFIIFRCKPDGHYGLGGIAAESSTGATTVISTRRDGEYGRSASHVELWYAGLPRGGHLELSIDDAVTRIETEAPAIEDRWHAIDVEPGEHRVRVRAMGHGRVRVFGVVLETRGPGVVWDSLSMIGAFTTRLLAHDESHFRDQLVHRGSDLVVLGYGGNDLRRYVGGQVTIEEFQEETRAVLARVREARPNAGCLLTGIIEHEMSGSTRVSSDDVAAIVGAQRAAAAATGCAFFDVFGAMGGPGSFGRWRDRGLAAADGKHLGPRGRAELAGWMYEALVAQYVAWRQAR